MFRPSMQANIEEQEAENDKLKFLSEYIERTNKIVFETEFRKRLDKHRRDEEIKLEDRRKRLLDLLLCEAKLEQSLSHQKLAAERKSRRDTLIEEANRYRQLLESKNREVAEAKYDLQFYLNSPELRNRVYDLHAKEICKDRAEIQKMKEQDARDEAEWERQLLSQKSHFEEQLEREAKQQEADLQKAFVVAQENQRLNKELEQRKLDEKQNTINEEKAELERLQIEQVQISENEFEQRRKRLEQMRKDIEEHRKIKLDQMKTDKIVENYCYPPLKPEPIQDRREEMKRLREEQLRFMEYKKELERRDKCFDRYLDQQYSDYTKKKNRELCEKRKLERAKYLEIERQIMENNQKASETKMAQLKEERLERLRLAEECRRKQKELEDQIKRDEELVRQKQIEFGKQLVEQKEAIKQWREKEREREMEWEQKNLKDTELEYQRRLEKMLNDNPLYKKLHPWRKRAMGMVNSFGC